MDLKEIGVNTRNRIDSAKDRDLFEIPCERGMESLGSISHGFSYLATLLVGY